MNIKRAGFIVSLFMPAALLASPQHSPIKARIEGVASGSMSGKVVFSSDKPYVAFDVYLNTGSGTTTKVCQQSRPAPAKEYQCAFSATAPAEVNAVNIYVVGTPPEISAMPDQEMLAIANPAYQVPKSGSVSAQDKSVRLQLQSSK